MIVELFGAPGSGKTTICNQLEEESVAVNVMDRYREHTIGKIYMHFFWKTFFFKKNIKKKYNYLMAIFDNAGYSSKDLRELITFIMFTYFLEEKFAYSEKKLIFDEGVVHYMIALYAEYGIDIDTLNKVKSILSIPTISVIGLDICKENILRNIKKRNRHRTKMDSLSDSEMSKLVDRYQEGIKFYSTMYPVYNQKGVKNEIRKMF